LTEVWSRKQTGYPVEKHLSTIHSIIQTELLANKWLLVDSSKELAMAMTENYH